MILNIIVAIILLGAILFMITRLYNGSVEGMDNGKTNSEAIANIASLYNQGKMTVTNLDVTREAVANSLKAKNLLVESDKENVAAYNTDVANALNDLNSRLKELTDKVDVIEKNYLDTRNKYNLNSGYSAILGRTDIGGFLSNGTTFSKA